MKLNDNRTAETAWEDDNGAEWKIRITFHFHKGEKQTHDCPGEPEHVEITGVDRMEPLAPYIMGWNEFNGETEQELIDWECDILEAINQQVDDRGNEK